MHSCPYRNWYVDGGKLELVAAEGGSRLHGLSYEQLEPVRRRVLERMGQIVSSGEGGPELLRSSLREMGPTQLGVSEVSNDPKVQHFVADLFTDGSGSQIYSTTFVQWSGREILRRARPNLMFLRYAPRIRQQSLNRLASNPNEHYDVDAVGSLVDAEMGVLYTFLEAKRIASLCALTLLAWHEGTSHALLVAKGAPAKTTYPNRIGLREALTLFDR